MLRFLPSAPVLGSIALHVAVAVTFGRGAGGSAKLDVAAAESHIEVAEFDVAREPEPESAKPDAAAPAANHAHSHEHAYAVAADHDAHPHAPELEHSLPHAAAHSAAAASANPLEPASAAGDVPSGAITQDFDGPTFALPSVGAGKPSPPAGAAQAAGNALGGIPSGAGTAEVATYAESGVSVPARLRASAGVAYPASARAEGMETDVALLIVVDANGRVLEASVAQRAGYGFDEAALAAIKRYTFTPAQKNGAAVQVRMRWAVQFRLN